MNRFFDNLKQVYEKETFDPSRIYNVDETGMSTVQQQKQKIIAQTGKKQIGKIVSAEKGRHGSCACGVFVPPMLIYPRKNWLAVGDAVKASTAINHFKIFMDKLYSLYSLSTKSQRALQSCASALGIELNRIGHVLSIPWVASSYRAVHAVWKSYGALYMHFNEASNDQSLDAKERSTFVGLAKKLQSAAFCRIWP